MSGPRLIVALVGVLLLLAGAAGASPVSRLPAPVYRTAPAAADGRIYLLGAWGAQT